MLVRGEQQGATIALGAQGINLNAGADGLADSDVSLPGVETVMVIGSAADDWVSGQGGHGTGGPSDQHLNLGGAGGNDYLHAGDGNYSFLWGEAGDDELVGAAQYDYIQGGPGNDTVTRRRRIRHRLLPRGARRA